MVWQSTRTVMTSFALVAANDWVIENFMEVYTGCRIKSPPIKTTLGDFYLIMTLLHNGEVWFTLERPDLAQDASLKASVDCVILLLTTDFVRR